MDYDDMLDMFHGVDGYDSDGMPYTYSDDEPYYSGYDDEGDEYFDYSDGNEDQLENQNESENQMVDEDGKERENLQKAQQNLLKGVSNGAEEVSRIMGTMYNNQRYSDITLAVGEQRFYAHCLVLSAWSDVFKTMLCNSSWQQSDDQRGIGTTGQSNSKYQELVEEECCEEVFSDFLKFLYSSSIDLTKANVLPLILLADKYLVKELRELCEEFIRDKQNDVQEVVSFIHSASQFGMSETVKLCLQMLLCNFSVLTVEQLLSLQAEHLKYLLDSGPSLVVDDEYTLFTKIEPWLDQCQAVNILVDVIKLIRFPYMNALQLKKARETPAFRRAQEVMPDILLKAWQQQALYNEASLKDLPDDFPWPRLYLNSNDETKFKDRRVYSSRLHFENKKSDIVIGDGSYRHSCIHWEGQRIDQKQIFTLTGNSMISFSIEASRSPTSSNDVIIRFDTDQFPDRKCHVGVRFQDRGESNFYFSDCFPPLPPSVKKSSSAYEASSRKRSAQFKFHTEVLNSGPLQFLVAVILEDKNKESPWNMVADT